MSGSALSDSQDMEEVPQDLINDGDLQETEELLARESAPPEQRSPVVTPPRTFTTVQQAEPESFPRVAPSSASARTPAAGDTSFEDALKSDAMPTGSFFNRDPKKTDPPESKARSKKSRNVFSDPRIAGELRNPAFGEKRSSAAAKPEARRQKRMASEELEELGVELGMSEYEDDGDAMRMKAAGLPKRGSTKAKTFIEHGNTRRSSRLNPEIAPVVEKSTKKQRGNVRSAKKAKKMPPPADSVIDDAEAAAVLTAALDASDEEPAAAQAAAPSPQKSPTKATTAARDARDDNSRYPCSRCASHIGEANFGGFRAAVYCLSHHEGALIKCAYCKSLKQTCDALPTAARKHWDYASSTLLRYRNLADNAPEEQRALAEAQSSIQEFKVRLLGAQNATKRSEVMKVELGGEALGTLRDTSNSLRATAESFRAMLQTGNEISSELRSTALDAMGRSFAGFRRTYFYPEERVPFEIREDDQEGDFEDVA